ncbi:uncharacterized protein EV422DRAFT_560334 [Fimicolochytrium jonesii]|uniref:uncharacterized protein n=1 Tax=Fimicolochytrium jonesii TaxID=1396493 RepID=UPI0022FE4238|nr:uncharacterized protein EV422DRAFT_560334 [Fimicolochytrium jonesii]KAI8817688.1 hypothetical protein EV422DRAFT_560334 [Fimicolochytrium jonesii]
MHVPKTMHAWTHDRMGLPAAVLLYKEIPTPQLANKSSVVVRVTHAALNPVGTLFVQLTPTLFRKTPCVPELDFSGEIVEVGSGVPASRGLQPGTKVFGSIWVPTHVRYGLGALSEYISVHAESVVPVPKNVTLEEAGGMGITGATAILLLEKANLRPGDSVLVNGASGGVGILTVQLAKAAVGPTGKVVGICSGKNADFVKQYGVDEVVDYTKHSPVTDYLAKAYSAKPFDAVIDAIGKQEIYDHAASYLAPKKPVVTVGLGFKYTYPQMVTTIAKTVDNTARPCILGGVPRPYITINALVNLKLLEKISALLQEGTMRPVVDQTFDFRDTLQAYEKIASKRARGKVTVKVQEPSA